MDAHTQWMNGLDGEVAFWDAIRTQHPDWFAAGMDRNRPLDQDVDDALAPFDDHPTVLDVGCGMLSSMGVVSRTGKHPTLLYADPLADCFAEIAKLQGFELPIKIIHTMAEYLYTHFDTNSVDVVYCRNALDHCSNLVRALMGMAWPIRPKGSLILKHYLRCATRNNHQGLHQWDIYNDGGNLWIAGAGDILDVGAIVAPLQLVALNRYTDDGEEMVRAIYRRD